jgi:hypothetical protein
MSNYSIKIDLLKVSGAALVNLKGKTATKQCIVIPTEDAALFVGEKGVYLSLQAIELKEAKYEQTHLLKEEVESEKYKAMTDEERKKIPIVGGMKKLEHKPQPMQATTTTEIESEDVNDLPF